MKNRILRVWEELQLFILKFFGPSADRVQLMLSCFLSLALRQLLQVPTPRLPLSSVSVLCCLLGFKSTLHVSIIISVFYGQAQFIHVFPNFLYSYRGVTGISSRILNPLCQSVVIRPVDVLGKLKVTHRSHVVSLFSGLRIQFLIS